MAVANLFEWLKILPLKTSGLGVLAIVGILCYRGFPIPESHIKTKHLSKLLKMMLMKNCGRLVRQRREGW